MNDELWRLYEEVFGDVEIKKFERIPIGVFCGMEDENEKSSNFNRGSVGDDSRMCVSFGGGIQ